MTSKIMIRAASCGAVLSLVALSASASADETDPVDTDSAALEQAGPEAQPCCPAAAREQAAPPPSYGAAPMNPYASPDACCQPSIEVLPSCQAPITIPSYTIRPPTYGIQSIPQPPVRVRVLLDQGGVTVNPPCGVEGAPGSQMPPGQEQGAEPGQYPGAPTGQ
jgi:hypothetical protein